MLYINFDDTLSSEVFSKFDFCVTIECTTSLNQ